eukprot:COSAG04_NODE_17936_length_455_cov_1.306180_1_plen_65_part_10
MLEVVVGSAAGVVVDPRCNVATGCLGTRVTPPGLSGVYCDSGNGDDDYWASGCGDPSGLRSCRAM